LDANVGIQVHLCTECALSAIELCVFVVAEASVITANATEGIDAECRMVTMVHHTTSVPSAVRRTSRPNDSVRNASYRPLERSSPNGIHGNDNRVRIASVQRFEQALTVVRRIEPMGIATD
jgi:hypothetical protein